jgi:hypothetical protein
MAYFQTKNTSLGNFTSVLQWKMLVYFTTIWSVLRSFGTFCGHLVSVTVIWYILWPFGQCYGHLVHFVAIWFILWSFGHFVAIWYFLWSFGIFYGHLVYICRFGMLYQDQSGNPAQESEYIERSFGCSDGFSRRTKGGRSVLFFYPLASSKP